MAKTINKPGGYIGPPVTPKPDDPIGPPIPADPTAPVTLSVPQDVLEYDTPTPQEPSPTGPYEVPTTHAHATLSELNASQVKVTDTAGNLYYLEASRQGQFVLRPIPKGK